jgi:glycosyltransferase involved in cell wall biosynthesis
MNRYAHGIVCNSYSAYQYIIDNRIAHRGKVFYIPNGIEIKRFAYDDFDVKRRTAWPPEWYGKVIVGTVGHLTPVKNPEHVLHVAERVIQHAPNTRFVLVGDGKLRALLESKISELNLAQIVFLVGERDDIPDLLRQMDIFLLTSSKEGMPNSLVEAMASGLPCIATDVGDCRKLITESGGGAVFSLEDLDGMAQYLIRLVSDADYRRALGERGHIFSKQFAPDKMANRFLSVYEQVLSGNVRKNEVK